MNKKIIYRVEWYFKKTYVNARITIGHAEMLSLKRQLKRQGFEVKVERYEDYK